MEIVNVLKLIVDQLHRSSFKKYLFEDKYRYSEDLMCIDNNNIKNLLLNVAKGGIYKSGLVEYVTSSADDMVLNLDNYAQYLSEAYNLEYRDYSKLLNILASNTIIFKNILKTVFEACVIDRTIHEVIDIGGGHDGYVPILKHVFPNLQSYYIIDKRISKELFFKTKHDCGYKDLNVKIYDKTDAFDFIKSMLSHSNPTNAFPRNAVIFMSEFLHCKRDNIKILEFLKGSGYGILINELIYDPYIDLRLTLSGGKIVQPKECADVLIGKKVKCDAIMYSTMFNYYLMRFKNV